jgi:hypothetical protein
MSFINQRSYLKKLTLIFAAIMVLAMVGPLDATGMANDEAEPAQPEAIVGLIEVYGLHTISRDAVIEASGLQVGDKLKQKDFNQFNDRTIARIQAIPGVRRAAIAAIYGHLLKDEALGLVVYIGIEENGYEGMKFENAPNGNAFLSADILSANEKVEHAFISATARGQFSEDDSQGFYLAKDDPDLRAAQEHLIPLAKEHWDELVNVLHNARNSKQRAIAALVIAYADNKKQIVEELAPMARDPDPLVRNNSIRAISIIFQYAKSHPELSITPPPVFIQTLVEMLNSLEWTDHNKATGALLTLDDDENVLKSLREQAVPSLVEMSRWHSNHGIMAFVILGKLVGMTHQESSMAWKQDEEREKVISRVLDETSKKK